MTAPLFVTSTMAEAPLRKMLSLKSYGSKTGIAALDNPFLAGAIFKPPNVAT